MTESDYKLLKQIEKRPAMWTGDNTLKSIQTYLCGYYHALHENGLVDETNATEPFFDWIAKKLNYNESTAGWAKMILASSMGLDSKNVNWDNYDSHVTNEQHKASIKRFYELLEEFVNEK